VLVDFHYVASLSIMTRSRSRPIVRGNLGGHDDVIRLVLLVSYRIDTFLAGCQGQYGAPDLSTPLLPYQ